MDEYQEVLNAMKRAMQNMFQPGGYIGESKTSDLFTKAGLEVFDKAVYDARVMAKYIQSLLDAKNGSRNRMVESE
jgi:hypothetical protein